MTSQEPENPHSADSGIPDTEVLKVSAPAPVFVDTTGRRRRFLRRLAYGFGALCMMYGGLVSVSLAGGPVSSSAVLPLPDLDDDEPAVMAAPPAAPATPVRAQTVPTQPRLINEALRRPETREARRAEAPRSTVPARTPAPPAKQTTKATVRPVESATVSTTPTGSGSPSPSTPVPDPTSTVVPPVPPVPPKGGTG
ncbi:hypothetical protein AB0M20_04675, partial [Actinoplanes sp. NPDC051633]